MKQNTVDEALCYQHESIEVSVLQMHQIWTVLFENLDLIIENRTKKNMNWKAARRAT